MKTELKKAFKETKKIIKKYNKNRIKALRKSRFKEFIRKILTRKCNKGKKANLIILDELHRYKESGMYNNIIASTPEEHDINNWNKYLYRAEYMQNPFEILTEENLERLEKHCKKVIHYERGEIKKEHEVTLCLLYRYQEQQEELEKKDKQIKLEIEGRDILVNLNAELNKEIKIKDKMIDSMADMFLTIAKDRPGTIYHYLEKNGFSLQQCSLCYKQEKNKNWTCAECFKEHFRKEVKKNG